MQKKNKKNLGPNLIFRKTNQVHHSSTELYFNIFIIKISLKINLIISIIDKQEVPIPSGIKVI